MAKKRKTVARVDMIANSLLTEAQFADTRPALAGMPELVAAAVARQRRRPRKQAKKKARKPAKVARKAAPRKKLARKTKKAARKK